MPLKSHFGLMLIAEIEQWIDIFGYKVETRVVVSKNDIRMDQWLHCG